MPLYSYTCRFCGHDFDAIRPIDSTPPPCPACSSEDTKRLVAVPHFTLAGDGWARDGYAGKKATT
jgi:putative FmdB family regulatory protein